jgi:hypothetical protein
MKFAKTAWFMLILFLVGAALAPPARADQWNKKTIITFSQPMEVPGNMTLPAGKYVFKLLDSSSYRHIVQIWNEDETKLFTTILAIPNYRLTPTGETVISFKERPGDQPQALRAWFYPGDNFGQEFAYPKTRALQLAEASNATVPAETAEPTAENLETVPLVAVTPSQKEEPIAEAAPVQEKTTSEPAMVAEAKELPQTASPIPLLGLLGFVSVGLAFGLRLLVKPTS